MPVTNDDFVRFDMKQRPLRQRWYLRPVTWILSFPAFLKHHTKITRLDMEGVKPPYLLLGNHNAFYDFKVATMAMFPHRANYVVAIDGFIGREKLMRLAGCICKRKFTNDILLIRQLKRVIDNGDILVIYPEARYSLCGTTAVLPESVGKLAKFLDVPVVTLITHGNHINSPFWNLHDRGVRTEAVMRQLFTRQQVRDYDLTEINQLIKKEFQYDDFAWQLDQQIRITYPKRAEGLHKVLYQCPHCQAEYQMHTAADRLWCSACHKEWTMDEYSQLHAVTGPTEFTHIPDWYEWERAQVRNEVRSGRYHVTARVRVDSLPNATGFIPLGDGDLTHDQNGFRLTGRYNDRPYELLKPVDSMYSCHIEYDYLGKYGDCIDLNTLEDTFYIYPYGNAFSVTKIALATEELYNYHVKD